MAIVKRLVCFLTSSLKSAGICLVQRAAAKTLRQFRSADSRFGPQFCQRIAVAFQRDSAPCDNLIHDIARISRQLCGCDFHFLKIRNLRRIATGFRCEAFWGSQF
jgi:hypothetical protein